MRAKPQFPPMSVSGVYLDERHEKNPYSFSLRTLNTVEIRHFSKKSEAIQDRQNLIDHHGYRPRD